MTNAESGPPGPHYLRSLDVLRGLAVAGMIVVNNPGDWSAVFPPLLHAYWTGLTVADLVFPAFIFIMGVAMAFAFARRREIGATTTELYWHIGRRVVVLIALGLVLNAASAWPDVSPLRFPGVLQRIALAYLISGLIVLYVRPSRWLGVAAALVLGHWALLALVPFGNDPAGTMTPEHNLASFIDARVFGMHALRIPNDPEGLLGTLTASATTVLGAAAGEWIRRVRGSRFGVQGARTDAARLRGLVSGGAAALAVGAAWSFVLPLSKPLWTGSFVLVTAGITTLALALIDFVVDVRGLHRWSRPFIWLGANALALYAGSEIARHVLDAAVVPLKFGRTTPKAWLFWEVLQPAFAGWPTELVSLAFAAVVLTLWIAVGAGLYRWGIRVRV